MILKIWLQIILIMLLLTIPLVLVEVYLQNKSLNLIFSLHQTSKIQETLDNHLDLLKESSHLQPDQSVRLKNQFQKTLELKHQIQDVNLLKPLILKSIIYQVLLWSLALIGLFLAISFLFSRKIVQEFQKLLRQNLQQAKKITDLKTLSNWQKGARMLIHELRSPLTPIKLIATDIYSHYEKSDKPEFDNYLQTASTILQENTQAIERYLQHFTQFAKLPEVQLNKMSIFLFFDQFKLNYQSFQPEHINLEIELSELTEEFIYADSNLLNNLFFNLLKNAYEANKNQKITFKINVKQNDQTIIINCFNSGEPIPSDIYEQVFEPYISSKTSEKNINMGLGLSICKKIALDHGGDLRLISSSKLMGVTFELELPFNYPSIGAIK